MIHKFIKLFTSIVQGQLLASLKTIIKLRKKPSDVIFYGSSLGDLEWLKSSIEKAKQEKITYHIITDLLPEKDEVNHYWNDSIEIYSFLLKYIPCKIFITSSTGLQRLILHQTCSYRIHMPHSLVSLHMVYSEDSFDFFNVIFAAGRHHIDEVAKLNEIKHIKNRTTSFVGYGKFDNLCNLRIPSPTIDENDSKTILIAPSWGPGNVIESIGIELIEGILNRNQKVVLRPHPGFFKHQPILMDKISKLYGDHINFRLDLSFDSYVSIHEADILISDYSGIAFEFAFVRELPVLFVDVPLKIKNKNWQTLDIEPIEISCRQHLGIVCESKVDIVMINLNLLEKNLSQHKEKIITYRNRIMGNTLSCSENVIAEIKKLLSHSQQ